MKKAKYEKADGRQSQPIQDIDDDFSVPHSFLNKYYSRGREKVGGRERVRSAEVWALDHPFIETFTPDISPSPP